MERATQWQDGGGAGHPGSSYAPEHKVCRRSSSNVRLPLPQTTAHALRKRPNTEGMTGKVLSWCHRART
jgi:hypothetical protein